MLTASPIYLEGLVAYRAVNLSPTAVGEHKHQTVALTVPLLGSLNAKYEHGEKWLSGPSAVLHPEGVTHAGAVGELGLEAIEIEFDPGWLRYIGVEVAFDQTQCWDRGRAAGAALTLARTLNKQSAGNRERNSAVATFFQAAMEDRPTRKPRWLDYVQESLKHDPHVSIDSLSEKLSLNPAWLGHAYRAAVGEGMLQTATRIRMERAAYMIRQMTTPLAQVAIDAGFYDQSHMNRCFRAFLGRKPTDLKGD
jgi:AraC family transcriptional regulator